jgi:hypothetical protein
MVGTGPPRVAWRAYKPSWYRREAPTHHRAVLTRRVIADGKPVMKEIGYVACFDESRVADPSTTAAAQREFWSRARFNLGRMRLPPNQIQLIEKALAQRVPEPEELISRRR